MASRWTLVDVGSGLGDGVSVGTGVGDDVQVGVGTGVSVAGGTQISAKGTTGGGSASPQRQPSTLPGAAMWPLAPRAEYCQTPSSRCQ
jgi:hypothetical protein